VDRYKRGGVKAKDVNTGATVFVSPLNFKHDPELVTQFTSRDYGAKTESVTACWTMKTTTPCTFRWTIVPVCAEQREGQRLRAIQALQGD
jgi:hypothetical protein